MGFTPTGTDFALLLVFFFLFAASGWLVADCVLKRATHSSKDPAAAPYSCLEWILCGLLGAFAVTSVILLFTAQAGIFRVRFWLLLLAGFDLAMFLLCVVRGQNRPQTLKPFCCRFEWKDLWLLPLVVFAFWMMNRPAEFVATYRDPGEYVNIAVRLSDSPSLRIRDPQFQNFNTPEKQALFLREPLERAPLPEVLPGFYLADAQKGELLPQFFHLYPLWLALCFKLWRFDGIFLFNVLLGTFSVLFVAGLAEQLFSSRALGWAAGLLLANNAGQIWMSRSPFSEILVQLFLLGGLTLLGLGMRRKNEGAMALAGIVFGLSLFVRIDSILILLGLSVSLVCPVPNRRWLVWPLAGVTVWGLLHIYFFSFPYFVNVYRTLEQSSLWTYLGLRQVVSVGLVLFLAWALSFKLNVSKFLPAALMILLGVVFLYGIFVRPRLESAREVVSLPPPHAGSVFLRNELNWARLGWYLTPLGLGMALLGTLLVVRSASRVGDRALLLPFAMILAALGGFYLYKSRAFPDNYWVIRRYVEIVIPGGLLLACFTLQKMSRTCFRLLPEKAGVVLASALYLLILAGEARAASDFWRQRELQGTLQQLELLAGMTKDADILLLEQGEFQEFFSGPLKFIFKKAVYPLATDRLLASDFETVIDDWQRQGKRIYLLASLEQTRVESRRIRFNPRDRFVLKTRVVEPAYDRLPQSMMDLQYHLQIYELQLGDALPLPKAVTLNMDFSFGRDTRGFHSVETSADHEAFRWTSGLASLVLPALSSVNDARLTLRLAQEFPAGVAHSPVRILFNRQPLLERVLTEEFQVIRCRIPKDNLNTLHSGENGITFESSSYSPADAASSDDRRRLGLMVEGIRLESLTPISKADPFMVDLGSEADLLHVDLSGFYERDRDSYRWTGSVANVELPAPIDSSEQLLLSLRAVKSCPDPAFRQWLTVDIDGQSAGTAELVGTGTEFKVYEFPLPRKHVLTPQPVVRFSVTPAWNPAKAGDSADSRTLGCAIDWIRIE